MEKHSFFLSIRCMTYNHAKFIADTMTGFCMQETKFPFLCVIVDDASTDGAQQVICDYITKNFNYKDSKTCQNETTSDYSFTLAQHNTNKNCFFAVYFLKYNHRGRKSKEPYYSKWLSSTKYNAICEGDDYWTYPLKLQKQVDFLENHSEFVLTCHRYSVYDCEKDIWYDDGNNKSFKKGDDVVFSDYISLYSIGWLTKTLTLLYRSCALTEEYRNFKSALDVIRIYFLLEKGYGICFNENWGVYRKSFQGICSKQTKLTNLMRSYRLWKLLYMYKPNSKTRRIYYETYASTLLASKGKLLLNEHFELFKFCSLVFYIPLNILRHLKSLFRR